ncbi:MAG: hypothetical protein ABL921_06340 [Pirellula sp.]
MFDATTEYDEENCVTKHSIICGGSLLTYAEVLCRWAEDVAFSEYFAKLLGDSPFSAYRWETPAATSKTVDRPFEFVLIDTPRFISRRTDAATYCEYFTDSDVDDGLVTFKSLGGDATLVVPSPRTHCDIYGHLAAFIRGAPKKQIESLWRVVSETVTSKLGDKPVWLSTAGGGVAWLHMRIDTTPKYYGYSPYRKIK